LLRIAVIALTATLVMALLVMASAHIAEMIQSIVGR
jgi:hypothetical protein